MIVITVNRYMDFEVGPLIPHVTMCYSAYTGINWVYIKAANLAETWSLECHTQSSGPSVPFSFPESLSLHSFFPLFFLSDPNFSAVSGLLMVLNQHIKIVAVWEKKHSLVAVLQISRLKACHSRVIYYTDLDTHSLVHIVFYSLDRVFCCSQLSRSGESLDIHNLTALVCFKCPATSEPSQHRGLLVQIS